MTTPETPKPKKPLYAIAYEYRVRPGVWRPEIEYMHAEDNSDARLQFFRSEPNSNHRHMRIVGIAPVLGYFVNDNKGDALSV